MRDILITVIADMHGQLIDIPSCDILLLAGDICPNFTWDKHIDAVKQSNWLNTKFRKWLDKIPVKHAIGVAGNHDWVFQIGSIPTDLRWKYLQDESTMVDGLKIYGTPWQPEFCNWAFNLSEYHLRKKFLKIPDGLDILLCHGPPLGFGDKVYEDGDGIGNHLGSESLRIAIERTKPKWCMFGHIHTGSHKINEWNGTKLVNVSLVDEQYNIAWDMFVFKFTSSVTNTNDENSDNAMI